MLYFKGSQAYAKGLLRAQLITESECVAICKGLDVVGEEWRDNRFVILSSDEDIHTANERRLTVI